MTGGHAFEIVRFHAGGRLIADEHGTRIVDQIYVERVRDARQPGHRRIVLVHGTDQTGLCFLQTTDGRPGWAYDFAARGWDVYVVDQVARGRSAYDAFRHGPLTRWTVAELEGLFTGAAAHQRFPGSEEHTRWPAGPGVRGNPAFDAFAASQVASLGDLALAEELNTNALTSLLRKIGGAVLLTHSQSSVFGFQLCDREPSLVDAHITVEPNGPPFYDLAHTGAPDWYQATPETGRPWGLTRQPLQYDPPAVHPDELRPVMTPPASPHHPPGWLQAEPARRLPRLASTPVAIVTAAASYRTQVDPWTCRFLTQAGVPNTHIRLQDHGISGNGHMMMIETNSQDIADLLSRWAAEHTRS
ncbi:MAG TPA: hypothetical protein VJ914_38420 [Pseudonocardiaceae bacterium]|nr:hypothetical protein [Pseudonocardiaceae bacterium]